MVGELLLCVLPGGEVCPDPTPAVLSWWDRELLLPAWASGMPAEGGQLELPCGAAAVRPDACVGAAGAAVCRTGGRSAQASTCALECTSGARTEGHQAVKPGDAGLALRWCLEVHYGRQASEAVGYRGTLPARA